ncbi:MAG: 6-phosphogluconolactonase [Myxococcaceae bacterium]|nr:6-phosphogluconolactonase [Myxococcaceae bacterium]
MNALLPSSRSLATACLGAIALASSALGGACSSEDTPSPASDADAAASSDGSLTTDGAASDANAPSDGGTGADTSKPLGPPRLYVGSGDGKIRVFAFDRATYALTPIDTIASPANPSFLAIDPARRFLYAGGESSSQITSFSIEPQSGKLTALGNSVGSGGNGPAHVSIDRDGRFVLAANYGGGTFAVFPRASDGRLSASSATRSFGGGAQTHQAITDPSNAFVLVPNKGLDAVAVFRLFADGGLADAGLFPAGDGARHIAFAPSGKQAYVIDELGSTVSAFTFDPATGALSSIQPPVSTLPAPVGGNTGAEIAVTPDGRHVIASNRGDDSLAVFDIDATTFVLTRTARVSTGGTTPRHFDIDATGQFLFAANQGSGSVVVMKIDATSGIPTAVGTPLAVPSPAFAGIFYLSP